MKTNYSLFLQVLIIIPFLIFISIYADKSNISLGLSFVVVALFSWNIYRSIHKQKIYTFPILAMLLSSFYLYALLGLGSATVPQSSEVISQNDSPIIFEFKTPVSIDKTCYYVGIDKNVNFILEYQKENQWEKFYSYSNSYPFSFRWRCITKPIRTSKVLLRITKNKMMLNEVRFFANDTIIPYSTQHAKLHDEANIKLDTSYYSGMYFDEIYHGRTAYEIMEGWEIYENTHPYLGKLLIIPGIKLFGMTPLGWRISNVFFAGLMIFIFYYFALLLFKEKFYALGASFLMTYGFMHITQARMAHIDTFSVLFVLLSYLFLYRFIVNQKLLNFFTSGLFFGLASAVKWSAVFSSLGFIFLFIFLIVSRHPLVKRYTISKLLLYGLYSYLVIAGVAYLLTFPEMYHKAQGLHAVINYNQNMYHYHSGMTQTHPYSSQWWSWALDIKPMGYYKQSQGMLDSSINSFGNPAIFWVGILASCYLLFVVLKKATLEAALILFAFLGLYLPYIFIERLMFIYHFYYATPFMMLSIVYMFRDIGTWKHYSYGIFIFYLTIVGGLFLAFYPVLSGYTIESNYINTYLKWFDTWWF